MSNADNYKACKAIHDAITAIAIPPRADGAEAPYGGWEYVEGMRAQIAEIEASYAAAEDNQDADMMAAATLDLLDRRFGHALDCAGGWAGWPHGVALARAPEGPRTIANPDSEAGRAASALMQISHARSDELMRIRASILGPLTRPDLKISNGEREADPRERYTWGEARAEMYVWLSAVAHDRNGRLDGAQMQSAWICDAVRSINAATRCKREISRLEHCIAKVATEIFLDAESADEPAGEKPLLDWLLDGDKPEPRKTRAQHIRAMAGDLRANQAEYGKMPTWAQLAGCSIY